MQEISSRCTIVSHPTRYYASRLLSSVARLVRFIELRSSFSMTRARLSKAFIERLNLAKSDRAAVFRATITMSNPSSTGIDRAVSRSRRFTRLRTTALPTRLLTEKPKRVAAWPFGRTFTTKSLSAHDRPSAHAVLKSAVFRKRLCCCISRGYTVRRSRPLNIRRFSTFLPLLLRIRDRKPCTRILRLFFG